ncbi:hypothetical protein H5410_059190 [Solanum commersonii]|uniref:Uncharacterized protein n=1 Tax=Solanum commersonii TaxID=4109 RepID=A0A9J5W256_SOLCO|nr:hypothetical protein H5410_059190 [Solanum commersonii]
MLIDLTKWAVMMICFLLDYNLLHCVEKIRLVSWQGDPAKLLQKHRKMEVEPSMKNEAEANREKREFFEGASAWPMISP